MLTEHPIKPRWFDELPFRGLPKQLQDIYESGPVVRTFVSECYTLAPHHLLLWLFMRIIISFSGAASLYISSLLLDLVEGVIENRNPDPRRLLIIGSARIMFSLVQWAAHESLYAATFHKITHIYWAANLTNFLPPSSFTETNANAFYENA